jgi:hypothetical protein
VIILDHEQGSPEWLAARLGKPSASMFSKLITQTGKPSSSADGYVNELIAERLTGQSEPFHVTEWMERGTALEPEAREAYEFISGNDVIETGFILDTSFEFGCSPDGLILEGESLGGLEIKCPKPLKRWSAICANPQVGVKKYWQQIQGCMWITKRDWWDFFAYHPEMPHVLVRVERDDEYIAKLAIEVQRAVAEILNQVEKLK